MKRARAMAATAAAVVWSWVTRVVGLQELLVAAALWLLAQGFLEFWRPGAFIVPGAVMLWMFLPQRSRLVEPTVRKEG